MTTQRLSHFGNSFKFWDYLQALCGYLNTHEYVKVFIVADITAYREVRDFICIVFGSKFKKPDNIVKLDNGASISLLHSNMPERLCGLEAHFAVTAGRRPNNGLRRNILSRCRAKFESVEAASEYKHLDEVTNEL